MTFLHMTSLPSLVLYLPVICSTIDLKAAHPKCVIPVINSEKKYEKINVLQNMQSLLFHVHRHCFAH